MFTGATAALRGFAAFASAKHGLRAVSASLARELGPMGVHVAHIVVDGGIDTPFVRKLMGPEKIAKMKPDSLANPDDIAEYVTAHEHN